MDDLRRLMNDCVTKQTISNYERGKTMPSRSFLTMVQKALLLPPYYFSEPQAELAEVELRYKGNYTTKQFIQISTC